MIGRLLGKVVGEGGDGSIVLDVNGVGYDLLLPLGSLGRVRREGDLVILHVHTHVREDALELFGFASLGDRALFRLLLSVQKVGPKLAMGILGALPPEEFVRAIRTGDVVRLSKIPGIGKKTGERLVLELKDKVPDLRLESAPLGESLPSSTSATGERLLSALINMGYRPAEAERAIRSLGDRVQNEPMPDLLREVLGVLRKGG